nr:MAG TPA: hypothetical protein [Caudoviricetes sp.]
MKSVLISIQPKWVEKIANGQKTIEVRKSAPKCEEPFKCYIYVTKAKKWFHSGFILSSNELLWLSSGKIKMCDGFELWADGEDYQCVNGKVIGEFICDNVYPIKNQGSRFFVANGELGVTNDIARQSCLDYYDMVGYLGNKDGYGWHISNLKIYDKPKELSEFYRMCKNPCNPSNGKILCITTKSLKMNGCDGKIHLTRPPQSYMFVEEVEQ